MKKNIKIIIPVLMLAGLVLHLPGVSFPQQEHQKIVEEVKVTWWQVPVFAVDKAGNPVTDLKPEDIQVQLNGRQMPAFTLHKRPFSVTQRKTEKIPGEIPGAKQLPMMKNKVVFLLFDLALSGETSTRLAKKIAQKIITEAETDTRFIVMAIDAFAGLVYIGEGDSKNKDELVRTIKDKVKLKTNKRIVDIGEILGGLSGIPGSKKAKSKYEGNELLLFEEAIAKWYKRKNMGFFYAFETLYFLLNSIEDNKFIYFFSEGMSRSILTSNRSLAGARGMYNYYLKRVANYLSRCGAVLFIINSMGVLQYSTAMGNVADSTSPLSGEDSLHFLAKESGGTYLEGAQEKIVERLENMHRAYYEISFPDVPQLKGATREINIIPKRKGIKIHSLNTLEKRKQYNQMNPVEKEMLVLNLITQPQNSLIKGKISAYNARVNKTKKSKKSAVYHVILPPGYLHQYIDLYKVWLTVNDQGSAQLEKIEKESLYPQKDRIKIQFQLTADTGDNKQKQEKKETGSETRTYFVLVNKGAAPVRASVHGMELYEEDPQLIEEEKKKIAKKRTKGETISAEEMHRILQGAAQYCEKLKQS
ncbi:MAG: hypothetical protein JSV88_29175, partial [Candidatus Aminicenantes bacterium]